MQDRAHHQARWAPSRRDLLEWLVLAVAYVAAARWGFRAAFVAEQVSPVWPASGLALAALVWRGSRVWPGIWIGALVANATTHVPMLAAAGIATGNTLEAVAGAWLLHRFGDVDRSLERLRHVTALIVASALLSTAISATIGVASLAIAGLQPWSRAGLLWSIWWFGDATGDLSVAPLLLTLGYWRRPAARARLGELAVLEAATVGLSILVFAVQSSPLTGHHPLEYAIVPLVIWAGLRFAHPGAALISGTVSWIAVWGMLHNLGPFIESDTTLQEGVILLRIYISMIATSGLMLGAAIADRNRSEALRRMNHALSALLSHERDLQSAAPRLLATMGDSLEWDLGILWLLNDDDQALRYVDGWHRDPRFARFIEDSRGRRFQKGIGLPGRVWATGDPAWITDVAADGNFPRFIAAREMGLHGGFAFPIRVGRTFLGVIEFLTRDSRKADASLLSMMDVTGSQIGQFITRRHAEEERRVLLTRERAARLDAENANRSKDQFLATVSHELRTPLTAILGWASMLKSRQFDAARLEQIYASIERNAHAQAQIINDLLDVSKIVSGRILLQLEPTDICDIARLSVETIRPTAQVRHISLVSAIPDGPIMVPGDAARLQQVLWNLLSNAAKFTPSGGTISLTVRPHEERVAIVVQDTGIGLAPELLPRVFERFWQADSTTTRSHGGLGLGLALVRHLVDMHGGEVSAHSDGEHRGCTFEVVLPRSRADTPWIDPDWSRAREATTSRELQHLTALVVDDDPAARELFAEILSGHGAQVVCAATPAEAYEIAVRRGVDVMVMDIGMPEETGFSLLQRIRAYEQARGVPPTPAIAVTAYAEATTRTEALTAGFAAHVPKPVPPHDMLVAVLQAVESRLRA